MFLGRIMLIKQSQNHPLKVVCLSVPWCCLEMTLKRTNDGNLVDMENRAHADL